jgi:hypothetical protein
MRPVADFARILDDTLAAADRSDAGRAPAGSTAPQVLGFFDFRAPGRQPFAAARVPAFALPLVPRVRHRLTLMEQRALDALIDLGASIAPDFTPTELRAAFRALAREYHPDRFPNASESDKARLARSFARARDAYQILKTAISADGLVAA